MTPFAQLEKSAVLGQGLTTGGKPFPFARRVAGAAAPAAASAATNAATQDSPSLGRIGGELALDIAAGTNPFTGIPYFGAKSINDFSKGNWGSGLANAGMGALSLIPGGGSVGAGIKGIGGALKGLLGFGRAAKTAKGVGRVGKGVQKVKDTANAAADSNKALGKIRDIGTIGNKMSTGTRRATEIGGWGGVIGGNGMDMFGGRAQPPTQQSQYAGAADYNPYSAHQQPSPQEFLHWGSQQL